MNGNLRTAAEHEKAKAYEAQKAKANHYPTCASQEDTNCAPDSRAYAGVHGPLGGTTPSAYGDACAVPLRPETGAESAIRRLSNTVYESTVKAEKASRVLDIISRRPEFFEFLEVLNSGLI